jgi:endonuclease/exonuclease/phosphatase family metal-dependent hydrolase
VAPVVTGAVLAVVVLGGCDAAAPSPRPGAPVALLQYNVQAHATLVREPARGARIAAQIADLAPELVGLVECDPCELLVDQMAAPYALVTDARAGVTAAYDATRWRVEDHGVWTLGVNDDGWGERVAMWVELEEIASGAPLLFYSTHWCVDGRSLEDACDVSRHVEYAEQIVDHARRRGPASMPVVVTGDLNAREGTAADAVLRAFADAGYVDTLRALDPEGEDITVNDGFRVDYIFARAPVEVLSASVDQSVAFELGSDHWPAVATVRFP